MRFQSESLFAAALLVALAVSPALAGGPIYGHADSVPGPVAGVGLAYLVLAGGYYVVRRWRKRYNGE